MRCWRVAAGGGPTRRWPRCSSGCWPSSTWPAIPRWCRTSIGRRSRGTSFWSAGSRTRPTSCATAGRPRWCWRWCREAGSRLRNWRGCAGCSTRRPGRNSGLRSTQYAVKITPASARCVLPASYYSREPGPGLSSSAWTDSLRPHQTASATAYCVLRTEKRGAPMLGWFAETTLVAAGLAAVAALGGRVRSIGPAARHALWLVVLIKMMTPPLVCWPWAVAGWGADWSLVAPTAAHAARIPTWDQDQGAGSRRLPGRGSEPWTVAAVAHRTDLDPLWAGCGPGPGAFPTVAAGSVEAPADDDAIAPGMRTVVPVTGPGLGARLARGLAVA